MRTPPALTAVRFVGALLVAVVIAFPLYWMVVVALSSRSDLLGGTLRLWPERLTLDNVRNVLDSFPVLTWFGNSVAIALTTAVITVTFNLLAGYAFAHLRFRGSTPLFLLMLGTLTLPLQVIMVALFRLVTSLGLYGSYWAVILPTAASAFGVFLSRQFLLAIPRDLIEAARIDGAGHRQVFTRIVLPMSKPLIAVLFFMSLLASWNDFAWPLIALKDNSLFTLPIGLLYLQSQNGPDYGGTMAFALINVAPMVIVFLVFQRFFVQGFARSGLR
ncbi:multiple sugar transport system permease protein/alpha-1,4-digalacturonate transport system permease protein [Friedmanniella endophytica]|uniref:Multiple sugar transport system permease protein/alpha-1,4-digalacturonate transport system permease protein n=1 Tax=Microlunatus kandeliicorticis TaxID=1759536 RepID=A0A7W3IQ69_9ACTN|nr:carbohydrate ABC transporter permease [Microlunatus kandeliicorticis]MBA8793207.1 multiple sugar transport system permease protein/alpha-1,4-digalacturonate transport system permease protein [Microlunatus kandeliicorticis]